MPNFLRPVHAWSNSSTAASALEPLPVPAPSYRYSQSGSSSLGLGLSIQPVPALAPVSSYQHAPPAVPFQSQGLRAPLFPSAAAVSVEDDDPLEVSDGSIPEVLFPPGKVSDLDRAISASGVKCFIGEYNLFLIKSSGEHLICYI